MGVSQSKPTKPQNPRLNQCSRAARSDKVQKSRKLAGAMIDEGEEEMEMIDSEETARR